ncbi:hypothetical protein [Methylomonas fluvii]|uniref:Uncharacterized protein n=1 Tax=Methylomonas fluvii TaxID=1854564 RepID=A0ABR9DKH7_9GAMM|nr:hypothetical protein [Methylomonas fluvii]MBD9363612.1 hypothetical protein [Methylomonas fluvii]
MLILASHLSSDLSRIGVFLFWCIGNPFWCAMRIWLAELGSAKLGWAGFKALAQSVLQFTRCNGAPSVPFNNGVEMLLVLLPATRFARPLSRFFPFRTFADEQHAVSKGALACAYRLNQTNRGA